jgi:hypothetical protein
MRSKASPLGLLVLTAALLVLAFASVVHADTGDIIEQQHDPPTEEDGFQAGTCLANKEPAPPEKFCSPETPDIFFKQAGGHPPIGFTQYIVKHIVPGPGRAIPVGLLNEIRVDLPPGLTVNPQATPQCPIAVFLADETNCPSESIVGKEELTVATIVELDPNPLPIGPSPLPAGFVIPPNEGFNTEPSLYNLEPEFGEPARFGFKIGTGKAPVFLRGTVDWESDYHAGFFIKIPPPSLPFLRSLKSRLVNVGTSGDGTYITNPTTCIDPNTGIYSTFLRAQAVADPTPNFPDGYTPWEAGLPPGVEQEGCDAVPFTPTLDVTPGTSEVDSPVAPIVTVKLPFEPDPSGLEQSHVRNADVVLPPGMGLNPSAANGLAACTDEQFGKGTRNPVTCPAASIIGTAEVETQPLPPGSLKGDVYLAEQKGFDPESGEMYRIFINPKSDRFGIDVRLIGNVKANAKTGQLTTTLAETPQVPFESVTLKLDPAKVLLTSPPTCGPNQTTSSMEPWARPGTFATPSSEFNLTSLPGGGPCPKTLAERPFGPSYQAGPESTKAGAFSPFHVRITRADGEQEIKRVDVNLPPGMVAKLRGVQYCPEENIAASAKQTGVEAIGTPICPDSSWVGTSEIAAGTGSNPFVAKGNAYLAGPYKGAPLSMVFATSAVAGPFDLGVVVVRVALNVDPETAQVKAVSDTIPDVFGGVKLDIRRIDVSISRKNFTLNPTTCREPLPIKSAIFGGGSDPADPAAWVAKATESPFRARECKRLKFKPKFFARIFGGDNQTRRAANPKFRAIFDAREGDANLRRAAFILPRATILDQSHIQTICTRVQLASDTCPQKAIYGNAKATSPLLKGSLKGPVYLTSSNNPLPDLLVDLRGQVDIQLRGVISSQNARLKTVFRSTPDVAVNKFTLTMKGGNRGLLVNSQNLCDRPRSGFLNLKAQNSRRLKSKNLRLNIPACRN